MIKKRSSENVADRRKIFSEIFEESKIDRRAVADTKMSAHGSSSDDVIVGLKKSGQKLLQSITTNHCPRKQ